MPQLSSFVIHVDQLSGASLPRPLNSRSRDRPVVFNGRIDCPWEQLQIGRRQLFLLLPVVAFCYCFWPSKDGGTTFALVFIFRSLTFCFALLSDCRSGSIVSLIGGRSSHHWFSYRYHSWPQFLPSSQWPVNGVEKLENKFITSAVFQLSGPAQVWVHQYRGDRTA